MSAFIVSTETMQRVIAAIDETHRSDGTWFGYPVQTTQQLDALGKALFAMNESAVRQRYVGCDDTAPEFRYRPLGPVPAVDQFMALSCLSYQCSEGDVPATPLYQAIEKTAAAVANGIAHALADERKVPWDWPERESVEG